MNLLRQTMGQLLKAAGRGITGTPLGLAPARTIPRPRPIATTAATEKPALTKKALAEVVSATANITKKQVGNRRDRWTAEGRPYCEDSTLLGAG